MINTTVDDLYYCWPSSCYCECYCQPLLPPLTDNLYNHHWFLPLPTTIVDLHYWLCGLIITIGDLPVTSTNKHDHCWFSLSSQIEDDHYNRQFSSLLTSFVLSWLLSLWAIVITTGYHCHHSTAIAIIAGGYQWLSLSWLIIDVGRDLH